MSEPQTVSMPASNTSGSRQLLFKQLREKKEARLGTADVIPRLGATEAELSFGQQRLWFYEQFEPGNLRFNILTALRMRGRLTVAALGASLDAMVRRHEVLRTAFRNAGGRPLQVVAPAFTVAVPVVDLAGLRDPGGPNNDLVNDLLTAEAHRPFNLATGPLLRALLLRLGPEEHLFVLAMHQITVDRWSRGLSVRELTALYTSFVTGQKAALPELSIQYSDFAQWQRRHLTGEVLAALLAYWRERLAGELPTLELPLDRPRPAVQTFRGGNVYTVLRRPLLERLEALAQGEGATLFMLLLAGFAALLSRITGQGDLILGSPIANRRHKQIEPLMGFFLNLLTLRVRCGDNPTFRELLGRARETALGAFAHQDLPFERLVEELAVARDLSRHPLFQTTLVLQNAAMPPITLPGLEASLLEVDWGTTAFDLGFFFWETALWEHLEEGLSVLVNYNADLFDGTTVRRLAEQLDRLLAGAAENPELRLADLPLLSAAERHQVVVEWKAGSDGAHGTPEVTAPWENRLERLFARQVALRPEAIALETPETLEGGLYLSYGELDRRAERLARALRRRDLGPEPVVALFLPPSTELATAILAVLKAGATYLPLALDLPGERLNLMLGDTAAGLVITHRGFLPLLPPGAPPVLCMEEETAPGSQASAPGDFLPLREGAGTLAYILYTSGSTGRPKAVGVPHRAVVRLVLGLPLEKAPRIALAATPAFDAYTFELWTALLKGGCATGLPREILLSGHGLEAELAARQIDVFFLPTALFSRLASAAPGAFSGLRYLLFGGETVDPGAVQALLAAGGPEHLLHVYGPTEATTFSAWHEVRDLARGATVIPIGRALVGTGLQVLDSSLSPVGIGIEGDLYITGAGLARGYLGRPAETAAAFLPDPFARQPGERRYRTGDRARWLTSGRLEFRGRHDQQIKIRGFRVEPEEVRVALAAHPDVTEAAVVVRETAPGDRFLVGYVVPRTAEAGSAAGLAAFLSEKLPSYMVPARFVTLPALPYTPGGKLDLAALPAPAVVPTEAEVSEPAPPRTTAELGLAAIWSAILGRERIGLYDDFFALGGHSLHAVQALAQVRQDFGVEIPVRSLYETPTLQGLARAIATASRSLR